MRFSQYNTGVSKLWPAATTNLLLIIVNILVNHNLICIVAIKWPV